MHKKQAASLATVIILATIFVINNNQGVAMAQHDPSLPELIGIRVEDVDDTLDYINDNMVTRVMVDREISLRLFGRHMDLVTAIRFSEHKFNCSNDDPRLTSQNIVSQSDEMLFLHVNFPLPHRNYFICLRPHSQHMVHLSQLLLNSASDHSQEPSNSTHRQFSTNQVTSPVNLTDENHRKAQHALANGGFVYQSAEHFNMIRTVSADDAVVLPFPVIIVLIGVLLIVAAVFSGLNIGLMALDLTELQVILKSGKKKEKRFAQKIIPLRSQGNYALCTILLGIAVVQSAVSILFNDVTSGAIAIIASTFGIVIFGEIIPQSICTRYGLAIAASTVWLMRFFMFLTAPLSWPASKVLDLIFGKDVGRCYSRERLLEVIKLSKETEKELENCQEVAIVSGALQMGQKVVESIMTPADRIFMISSDSCLDFATITSIVQSGYTRIPVYGATRNDIVYVVNVKDLALVDPDDEILVKKFCEYHSLPVRFVDEGVPMKTMLEEFKRGQSHVAFVVQKAETSEGSSATESLTNDRVLLGLVTLEDIIEEIIQSEIRDESDVSCELNSLTPTRQRYRSGTGFEWSKLAERVGVACELKPHLIDSAIEFLLSSNCFFKEEVIGRTVLRRLLKQTAQKQLFESTTTASDPSTSHYPYLYRAGVASRYFTLVLEGVFQVSTGQDDFVFDVGSFHYFGKSILEKAFEEASQAVDLDGVDRKNYLEHNVFNRISFVPDYSAQPVTDVVYVHLTASDYFNAFCATKLRKATTSISEDMVPPDPKNTPSHPSVTPSLSKQEEMGYIAGQEDSAQNKITATTKSKTKRHVQRLLSGQTTNDKKKAATKQEKQKQEPTEELVMGVTNTGLKPLS